VDVTNWSGINLVWTRPKTLSNKRPTITKPRKSPIGGPSTQEPKEGLKGPREAHERPNIRFLSSLPHECFVIYKNILDFLSWKVSGLASMEAGLRIY
jgi:hypothetical protein